MKPKFYPYSSKFFPQIDFLKVFQYSLSLLASGHPDEETFGGKMVKRMK
jgi:hypothetical protein